MLNSKQRAYLRGLANTIDTIVMVGKGGMNGQIIKQADDALTARELIKGKVLESAGPDAAGRGAGDCAGGKRGRCTGNRQQICALPQKPQGAENRIAQSKPRMTGGVNRLGILGGTFNPIHLGHIGLAQAFISSLKLDLVLLMPASVPPHKEALRLASASHRFNMCQIAARGHDKIEVSRLELERGGKSFTADTLRSLKVLYPNAQLYLITGADMFLTLQDWREPETIFSLAAICTAPRGGAGRETLLQHAEFLKTLGARCEVLKEPIMQVSSSIIRQAAAAGGDVSPLTGEGVAEYTGQMAFTGSDFCVHRRLQETH